MVLAAPIYGLFPEILGFIKLENDIVYNLTMNQSVIIKYSEVIRHYIIPTFYSYFSTFLVITLVLELITSWFTADILMMIRSFTGVEYAIFT